MTNLQDTLAALGDTSRHESEFRGQIFLIKLGGEVCMQPHLRSFTEQVHLIQQKGIRPVIVHGGGPQMDEMLTRLGVERRMVAGQRVTDADTLRIAKMVFSAINADLVCDLESRGSAAVGISGADGRTIKCSRQKPQLVNGESVDYGYVGEINEIDATLLRELTAANRIPVIASLGFNTGAEGGLLNINADVVATKIAQALKVKKMFLLSNVAGILRDPANPSTRIPNVNLQTIQKLIHDGVISGGMLPKVGACTGAVENGIESAHIIDGRRPDSLLLEIFSDEGCGTAIVGKGSAKTSGTAQKNKI